MSVIPFLPAALSAAAPRADAAIWLTALDAAMVPAAITSPRRVAAFLGQCAIEAGPAFEELAENMRYLSAARLVKVFPSRFRSEAEAQPYVDNPRGLANRVYAFRLGNGAEETGDGYEFRGSGLLQLTGRDNIGRFAAASGRGITAERAAEWLRTPAGAAIGAAWFWTTHSLNDLADAWALDAITLKINGKAMMHAEERRAACQRALDAIFAAGERSAPQPPAGLPPTIAPPPDTCTIQAPRGGLA